MLTRDMWPLHKATMWSIPRGPGGRKGGRTKEVPTVPLIFVSWKYTRPGTRLCKYVTGLASIKYRKRFHGYWLYYSLIFSLCIFLYAWNSSLKINMCYGTTTLHCGRFRGSKGKQDWGCGDSASSPNLKQLTSYMVLCNSQPFWNSRTTKSDRTTKWYFRAAPVWTLWFVY